MPGAIQTCSTMSCQCKGVEQEFNDKLASRELWWYRMRGPRSTTRQLIELVRRAAAGSVESLLDIGGGIGAIQHSFAQTGTAVIQNVDASPAYLDAAQVEASRSGDDAVRTYVKGDFVDVADTVAAADAVTLDRVICCYDDVEALVGLSAAKAKRVYGLVFPRVNILSRIAFGAINKMMEIRRSCFRGFLHSPERVDEMMFDGGFEVFARKRRLLWQIVVYKRRVTE